MGVTPVFQACASARRFLWARFPKGSACAGTILNSDGRIRRDCRGVSRFQTAAVSGLHRAIHTFRASRRHPREIDPRHGLRGRLLCPSAQAGRGLERNGHRHLAGDDSPAEDSERQQPLGCKYIHQDVLGFQPREAVDIVVAMYLLNYARTGEQLQRFCQVCHDALRPGGRFVGFNDNIRNSQRGTLSWKQYGIEKSCVPTPKEGDAILYTITNSDGREFQFKNFFLSPETYRDAFEGAGFQDFRWLDVSLHPAQRDNPFWDAFMTNPPVVPFAASR